MTLQDIKADRTISNWLKTSLETALKRDPVDALHDAQALLKLLEQHNNQVHQNHLERKP